MAQLQQSNKSMDDKLDQYEDMIKTLQEQNSNFQGQISLLKEKYSKNIEI